VLGEIQTAGVNALPILGLLSLLVGLVIAYQGGIPLRSYGANIFIVDLVAVTTLREMAPLLTAVIVAGRTGSAYAAQLGTMKITEEVDALRTLGITPFEMLVVPKLLGLLIVGVVRNGLTLAFVPLEVQAVFVGVILIVAVTLNRTIRQT